MAKKKTEPLTEREDALIKALVVCLAIIERLDPAVGALLVAQLGLEEAGS